MKFSAKTITKMNHLETAIAFFVIERKKAITEGNMNLVLKFNAGIAEATTKLNHLYTLAK